MRRFQGACPVALVVVLGVAGCDLNTSAPPALPQDRVQVPPLSEPEARGAAPAAIPSAEGEVTPPTTRETRSSRAARRAPNVDEAAQSATAAAASPSATEALRVRQVIDGDTITVSGIGTVRLLGVDAPEKTGGYRQAERHGDEATRFMRDLVDGKLVRLEYDGERQDQFHRTLAYVVLEDGTIANEAIIRAGWAETYRRFTYWRKADFQRAEREAREARRGMWATPKRQP